MSYILQATELAEHHYCVSPHAHEEPAADIHHQAQKHTISASVERDLVNSSNKRFPVCWLLYLIQHFTSMM